MVRQLNRFEKEDPKLILIAGIMAAGKSTVAQALAEKLTKCVHLRGAIFRRMIVSGREEREAKRDKRGYENFSVTLLDQILHSETARVGFWLDTSE